MGQSVPTTTMMIDRFAERYGAFRAELDPEEQRCFDELVCRARRHSTALNRKPDMDLERPMFLAMLIEEAARHDATLRRLQKAEWHLKEVLHGLAEAGVAVRRVSPPTPEQLARLGQARLPDA